jgi:hypothetical protein
MVRPVAAVLVTMLCVCACAERAAAQDQDTAQDHVTAQAQLEMPSLFVKMTAPAGTDQRLPGPIASEPRGPALPSLYATLIALQGYDGYSTNRGLKNGASEANAVFGPLTRHPAAVWAVKGGTAFASIYVAERLWRRHRRGQAIALMVVSNSVMAAVAANNAAILRRQR